jgi:probable selenium-dependent hydroxylase accessory protein YqeC
MPSFTPSDHPSKSSRPLCQTLRLAGPGLVAVAGSGGKTVLVEALCRELAGGGERVVLSTTTHVYPPPARLCGPAWLWGEAAPPLAEIQKRLEVGRVLAVARGMNPQGKLQGLSREQMAVLASSGAWLVVEADGAARKPLKAWASHEPAWPGGEIARVVLVGASALGRPFSSELVHRHNLFGQAAGMVPGDRISPAALARVLLGPSGPFQGIQPGVVQVLVINQIDAAPPAVVEALVQELQARAGGWLRVLKGRLRWGDLQPC